MSVDVALVLSNFSGGGAQRVCARLARHWADAGLKVAVVTLADKQRDAYALPPETLRISVGGISQSQTMAAGLAANIGRIEALRRALVESQARTVISFVGPMNVLTVLSTLGTGLRVIVSERNDPARQSFGRLWDVLRRLIYPLADTVTANSHGALASLSGFVPAARLLYIPNPIAVTAGTTAIRFAAPTILSVGRLHPQKAYDVLLPAFAILRRRSPEWRLCIVGDGPEGERLRGLARQLQIDGFVDWPGHVVDPSPYFRGADIFVLSSRHEGMPNALLEAMAHGLPSVVTDSSPGPLEVIQPGHNGLVARTGSADSLADALFQLAADPDLRRRLGNAARDIVRTSPFSDAFDAWDRLICASAVQA